MERAHLDTSTGPGAIHIHPASCRVNGLLAVLSGRCHLLAQGHPVFRANWLPHSLSWGWGLSQMSLNLKAGPPGSDLEPPSLLL